jgi:hypothetical protein
MGEYDTLGKQESALMNEREGKGRKKSEIIGNIRLSPSPKDQNRSE